MKCQRDPVYVAPTDEARDDTRQGTSKQHTEEHTRHDDAERGGTAIWRCHVADEWEHELWGDCGNGCDEGDGAEGSEGVCHAKADPASIRLVPESHQQGFLNLILP